MSYFFHASPRYSRSAPRRSTFEIGDVLFDVPVELHVVGKVFVELGKLLFDAIEAGVGLGFGGHLGTYDRG
jgi:hypothetical protein